MPCGCPYPIAPGMAGMVFREEFINIPLLIDNGGVLINSPAVDRGVTLNGTTQYVSYPNRHLGYFPGTGFVVVRFTPQFAWNEDLQRYFFRTPAGVLIANSIGVAKQNAVNVYQLTVYLGIGYVTCIGANYSAFWLQGQENVLVASLEGVSSAMWLNGNLLTTTKIAMSSNLLSSLYVGTTGASTFSGTIHSIRIGTKPITALDVPVLSVAS